MIPSGNVRDRSLTLYNRSDAKYPAYKKGEVVRVSKTTGSGWNLLRANLVLTVLFLGTFVLGSAELVVVGILNLIARDMAVSISTAGQLVTAYALGLSIGGPVLTALTIRYGRRPLLWLTLAAWLAGNVLAVVAANFSVFLVARVLTGSLQGLFVGVAFAVATSIVPPERVGRAMSAVIGGFAVSTALGVPAGILIGQELGWRGAFVAIILLGVAVLVASLLLVPSIQNTGVGGMAAQVRHALAPRVLAMLGLCALLFAGQYGVLTYIAPFLGEVTGISGGSISAFLLVYGAATAVGALGGGRFADRSATTTLMIANTVLILALGLLYLVGSVPILAALAMMLWGLVGFGLVPSLQYRVVSLAGPGGNLAATLPASAINAGIAIGALVGGWAVESFGASAPVIAGLIISAIALPATWATGWLKAPTADARGPANPTDAVKEGS